MKPLSPALREKRRYIAYEIIAEEGVKKPSAEKQILQTFQEYFGKFTMAKAGIIFLKDWKNNKGIFKVQRKFVDHARATLALITSIDKQKVLARCIGVSGTLKKARERYIND